MTDGGTVNVRNSLLAGALAGCVGKTVVAPIDRIKIVYQVNGDSFQYKQAFTAAHQRCQVFGYKDLWRGNTASLVRIVPYSAIRFSVHEQLKVIFEIRTYQQKKQRPFRAFTAGALAGLTAMTCTYPFDTARARMAVDSHYQSIVHVFKDSLFGGKSFLYKGFFPSAIGMVPYTGINFCIYELFKTRYFYMAKDEKSRKSIIALESLGLGILSTMITQTTIYPLDIVRRRFQTSQNHKDTIIETMRYIVETKGFRGLYNGITLSWIKNTTSFVLSMATFDIVYTFLNGLS